MKLQDKYITLETYKYKLILEKMNSINFIKKIKIYNTDGIFLTGIPNNININLLKNNEYLGQYGKILSIKLCLNKKKIEKNTYSVFVNYSNQLEASIAIISLNNFPFFSKNLKCSFSTNKICHKYYIKGNCKKKNCFYYHKEINKRNSIIKILEFNNNKIMELLFKKAEKILSSNINLLIESFLDKNDISIFPEKNEVIKNFILKAYKILSTKIQTSITSFSNVENIKISLKKLILEYENK